MFESILEEAREESWAEKGPDRVLSLCSCCYLPLGQGRIDIERSVELMRVASSDARAKLIEDEKAAKSFVAAIANAALCRKIMDLVLDAARGAATSAAEFRQSTIFQLIGIEGELAALGSLIAAVIEERAQGNREVSHLAALCDGALICSREVLRELASRLSVIYLQESQARGRIDATALLMAIADAQKVYSLLCLSSDESVAVTTKIVDVIGIR